MMPDTRPARARRQLAQALPWTLLLTLSPTLAMAGPPGKGLADLVVAMFAILVAAVLLVLGWHVLIMVLLWRAERPSTLRLMFGVLTVLSDGLAALSIAPLLFDARDSVIVAFLAVTLGGCALGGLLVALFTRRAWLRSKEASAAPAPIADLDDDEG